MAIPETDTMGFYDWSRVAWVACGYRYAKKAGERNGVMRRPPLDIGRVVYTCVGVLEQCAR